MDAVALRTYAGGAVFGERYGDSAPSVLAMHGWGRTRTDFATVLDGMNAIAIDLPGFGASPIPDGVWGAQQYADSVQAVLAEMSSPAVLVGHSFGGRVATVLAGDHPDLVAGAVLIGVPLLHRDDRSATQPDRRYRIYRWLHRRGMISDDRLETEKRRRGSADYRAAAGTMRDILVRAVNESYEEPMRRVQCPVRLVWGRNDDEVPVSVAERCLSLFADARLEVVEDVGHHVPLNAPGAVRRAIEDLL